MPLKASGSDQAAREAQRPAGRSAQARHFIFSRALRRFKGDEQLWLQWIEYAQRTRSHNRLSQIFGRSLALLPHSSRLWIKAAAWELEVRNNAQAARRLLQRALRVNSGEPELWAAYFRFELIFAQKVKKGRFCVHWSHAPS